MQRNAFSQRAVSILVSVIACSITLAGNLGAYPSAVIASGTIPPVKPALINANMECEVGYYPTNISSGEEVLAPDGWQIVRDLGEPVISSARIFFEQRADSSGGCFTSNAHVERIEGRDSVVVRAKDLETPPVPGKPFDVVLSQSVSALAGGDYSVSGWMLSLCGGSAVPSDCPDDVYMIKALGIDPTGGADPMADSVQWTEDLRNFVDEDDERIGWVNLRTAAQAEASRITVFARLYSPYQHHGNHGFIDSISIVRAPKAWFEMAGQGEIIGSSVHLNWNSDRSPDVDEVDGGTYEYMTDIQVREAGSDDWVDLATDLPENQDSLLFCTQSSDATIEFRIRSRAEQPPAPPDGAWPNHRYPGVWSEPMTVHFTSGTSTGSSQMEGDYRIFIPAAGYTEPCDVIY